VAVSRVSPVLVLLSALEGHSWRFLTPKDRLTPRIEMRQHSRLAPARASHARFR
jgi:hypothetical protein